VTSSSDAWPSGLHAFKAKRKRRSVCSFEGIQDYAIFIARPNGNVVKLEQGRGQDQGLYRRRNHSAALFSRILIRPTAIERYWPQQELELAKARAGSKTKAGVCARMARSSGRMSTSQALYDSDGQLRGFAKVTREMTERRRVETLELATSAGMNEFLAMLASRAAKSTRRRFATRVESDAHEVGGHLDPGMVAAT
jgi:hypothetical protein